MRSDQRPDIAEPMIEDAPSDFTLKAMLISERSSDKLNNVAGADVNVTTPVKMVEYASRSQQDNSLKREKQENSDNQDSVLSVGNDSVAKDRQR